MYFAFGIAVIMAISNPSKQDFVEHIKTDYVESSQNEFERVFSSITKGLAGFTANQCTRKDFVFFSVYKGFGESYIGVFGQFIQVK